MELNDTVALVTGANRGLGQALVTALVAAGARKVYAAGRDVGRLDALARTAAPGRIAPVALDVTDAQSVGRLAEIAPDVRLVVNNAGRLEFGDALAAPAEAFQRQFDVNVLGPARVVQALAPILVRARSGAIVNISSVVGLASMPGLASYNASKAALHSLTQSQRATLKPHGVSVHGVYPGPVDTDMAAEITFQKTSPSDVADAILAGVRSGDVDIFPDPMSAGVAQLWATDPRAVEAQFAAM